MSIQTPKDQKMKIKNKLINLVSLKKMLIGKKSNLPYKKLQLQPQLLSKSI